MLREHLVTLAGRTELLVGLDRQAFIDIDSLLRPVYGHAKQGASYGHTKIAGKQVLCKGLSPLATTISTPTSTPVIAGIRLRAGKTGSGKGAGRMTAQAIATARAAGGSGKILVRGDSAYGSRAVVRACLRGKAEFSLVMTKNRAIQRAIASIGEDQWTPVRYPNAVQDPRHRGVDLGCRGCRSVLAHPHSWERGSNENLNRIVREYFPKGVTISSDPKYLAMAASDINDRARKIHNSKKPSELFTELV